MYIIKNLFIFAITLKPNIMTKKEIKSELQDMIYLLNTLENQYGANRLKLVLNALEQDWNESDYYAQQIDVVLNTEETMENLNNIKIINYVKKSNK